MIANAEIPEEIAPFFRDIAEIPLPKGDENAGPITDLRPIGLQLSLKKLVNKCQMHETETKNKIKEHLINDDDDVSISITRST